MTMAASRMAYFNAQAAVAAAFLPHGIAAAAQMNAAAAGAGPGSAAAVLGLAAGHQSAGSGKSFHLTVLFVLILWETVDLWKG